MPGIVLYPQLDLGHSYTFPGRQFMFGMLESVDVLLILIQLPQFYQGQFLVVQTSCLSIISWRFAWMWMLRHNLNILVVLCRFGPHQIQSEGSLC